MAKIIHIVLGSMMSGKSEEILRQLNKYKEKGMHYQNDILLITGSKTKEKIESRISKYTVPAYTYDKLFSSEILNAMKPVIVYIEEYHLLSTEQLNTLLDKLEKIESIKVIYIFGIAYDWHGNDLTVNLHNRFNTITNMNVKVDRLYGICDDCGDNALHHYKISGDPNKIIEEKSDEVQYGVVCEECFNKRQKI